MRKQGFKLRAPSITPGVSGVQWPGNEELWRPSAGYTAVGGLGKEGRRLAGWLGGWVAGLAAEAAPCIHKIGHSIHFKTCTELYLGMCIFKLLQTVSGLLLLPLLTPIDAVRWASWCTMSLTVFGLMLPMLHLLGAPSLPAPAFLSLGSLLLYCFLAEQV